MSTAAVRRYTPEQYLALERHAEFKSEFYDGFLYAMAGASREHNLIASNLNRVIGNQLVDRPCEVYIADMRVAIGPAGPYVYPDVVALCGEPRFLDDQFDTLLNPTVVVEVLSPSSEAHDRGHKFARYRRIASLQEYVVVAQDRAMVERYARRGEDWLLTAWSDLADVLRLDSIGCEVPLREIYARVEFPPEAEEQEPARH
jgi:Uma2 family endonuclease